MVMKGNGVVLLGLLTGLFLLIANWPYLTHNSSVAIDGITGNSIKNVVSSFYETSSVNQRVFILAQVLLLIVIVVAGLFVLGRFKKTEKLVKQNYIVESDNRRSHTDLDVLYNVLKSKGEIDLRSVETMFKISPEVALGWAKILESGDLAEINYPRFGKPVLRSVEDPIRVNFPKESKNIIKKESIKIEEEPSKDKSVRKIKAKGSRKVTVKKKAAKINKARKRVEKVKSKKKRTLKKIKKKD